MSITVFLLKPTLVSNIARTGSNITGVSIFGSELDEKRLDLLVEMVPTARRMAALAESTLRSPGHR